MKKLFIIATAVAVNVLSSIIICLLFVNYAFANYMPVQQPEQETQIYLEVGESCIIDLNDCTWYPTQRTKHFIKNEYAYVKDIEKTCVINYKYIDFETDFIRIERKDFIQFANNWKWINEQVEKDLQQESN